MANIFLLILCWGITVLFYADTGGGGLVTDALGWFMQYEKMGWQGLVYSFDDKALHHVYHLVFFSLYKLMAFHASGWMLVMTFLHALNGLALYHVCAVLFRPLLPAGFRLAALAGSILFLVSPYQTEAVVWNACIHYLIATALLLTSLYAALQFLRRPLKRYLLIFYLCFLLSLFTLEIAFALPLMLVFLILLKPFPQLNALSRSKACMLLIVPLLMFLAGYFILNQIFLGAWVGHYGADTHLNFSPQLLSSNFGKYLAKYLLLIQFFPYDIRQHIYTILEKYWWLLFLISLGIFMMIFFKPSCPASGKALTAWLVLFAIGLSPVLNLYFTDVVLIEGDRLGYFASAFFYPFIVLCVWTFLPRIKYVLLLLVVGVSAWCLNRNTSSWAHGAKITSSLTESFRWYNAPHIYILNLPDNFNGAYMFRSFDGTSALAEHLLLKKRKDLRGKITEIVNYNMVTPFDSVRAEALSEKALRVELAQWGNWFWRNGIGATAYRGNGFEFIPDEWLHAYTLEFDSVPDSDIRIIYQCGAAWREFRR
ncbi:MAG: hypothetical protein KatS3mg031_2453 [Chitinophagales bacterium]|nr:MAG: hypothetical protein KatS3mg031_2453 [Chitinophagales bacterium]